MSFVNTGFELPGVSLGEAEGWTHSEVASASTFASFDGDALDWEDFLEGWQSVAYLFQIVSVVQTTPALMDTMLGVGEPVEDFEEGWLGNQNYVKSFSGGASTPVESFADWNGSYDVELPAVTPGSFDGEPAEDFEEGWLDNENYEMVLGDTTTLEFNEGEEEVEKFGPIYADRQMLAMAHPTNILYPASDIGTVPHGLEWNWLVMMVPGESGRLPGGLTEDVEYYVVNPDTLGNTIQLAMGASGVAISLSDTGAGAFYVRGDPRRFWLQRIDPIE